MIDLGTLGGTFGAPNALNNRGQVVGTSNLAGDFTAHPFLWDRGKLADLGTPGGTFATANGINDAGEVVGGGTTAGDLAFHAFLWRRGVLTDLGSVGGDCYSEALAINSRGQVVGDSGSCDRSTLRSFLWEDGSIVDLNRLIPPNSNLQLVETLAINDRGEIAGNGVPSGCASVEACGHAYVLIPSGEDDTEGTTAVSQNIPAPFNQSLTAVTQGSPAAIEMMARIRARLAHRYHLPGLATGPTH